MRTDMKRKMYMGVWRFMLPLPPAISAKGLKRGVSGAKTKADLLSKEERKLAFDSGRFTKKTISCNFNLLNDFTKTV